MKFKTDSDVNVGETRICSGFLWFPIDLDGEMRWLEHATWKERFMSGGGVDNNYWEPISWAGENKIEKNST